MGPDVEPLFESANVVHVATVMPDGSPHSVPVWSRIEDGRIAFFTQPTSQKARNLARDPRVAISVTARENPYWMAQVRGRVAQTLEGDAALEVIDRIAVDYTGESFPMRSGVVFLVDVEKEWSMKLPFEDTPTA
jgi:PPOX class probable F420-dependent enzyme